MYWLQPPPYARWTAAALLVLGAFWWDLRAPGTEPHPFAARDLDAGTALSVDDVRWRELPRGSFPVPELSGASVAVTLTAGEPLSAAVLSGPATIPPDWWAVSIDVPAPTAPGDTIMLVIIDPPQTVPGIVVVPQRGDRVSLDHRSALVAVPGDRAALVAAADAAGLLVTAVRPQG